MSILKLKSKDPVLTNGFSKKKSNTLLMMMNQKMMLNNRISLYINHWKQCKYKGQCKR